MSKFVMFFLAIYPILAYYKGLGGFSYAEIFSILLFIYSFLINSIVAIKLPRNYYYFWIYASISIIIVSLLSSSFQLTYLIPGGISFFIWSISLGLTIKYFNFRLFKKYLYSIFIFATVLYIGQELSLLITGNRIVFFLPLSDELAIYGMSFSELVHKHMIAGRSSSIFAEPSYYALYALIVLAIELFESRNKSKLYTPFSIFVVLLLLMLRSGVGLIGLASIYIIKFIFLLKEKNLKYVFLLLIVVLPITLWGIYQYMLSEIGMSMLERTEEFSSENSSAYLRIIRGYIVYDQLPILNKIGGISMDKLLNLNIAELMITGDDASDLYFNGIQTLLMRMGILGFLICFVFYYKVYIKSMLISKVMIWLLLFFSLLDQTFLSSTMLICTALPCGCVKKNNIKLNICS